MSESASNTPTVDSASRDASRAALLARYRPLKERAVPAQERAQSPATPETVERPATPQEE
jgi:hypothetical protein